MHCTLVIYQQKRLPPVDEITVALVMAGLMFQPHLQTAPPPPQMVICSQIYGHAKRGQWITMKGILNSH